MEKTITIRITSPVECTEQQFNEWIEFSIGYRASISIENPLMYEPFEARELTIE